LDGEGSENSYQTFIKLQKLFKFGKLILGERTLNMIERTFGIVILEVESED